MTRFSGTLLKEHNLSLAEVALLVGFSEQSSFTRAFKKWTGTTPAEFRRREMHALFTVSVEVIEGA